MVIMNCDKIGALQDKTVSQMREESACRKSGVKCCRKFCASKLDGKIGDLCSQTCTMRFQFTPLCDDNSDHLATDSLMMRDTQSEETQSRTLVGKQNGQAQFCGQSMWSTQAIQSKNGSNRDGHSWTSDKGRTGQADRSNR